MKRQSNKTQSYKVKLLLKKLKKKSKYDLFNESIFTSVFRGKPLVCMYYLTRKTWTEKWK